MEPKTEVGEEVLCKPKREMEPKTEEEQKEVKCKPMLKTVKELKTAEKGEEIKVLLWNINGYSLDKEKSAEGEVEIKVMGSGITPPARHAIVASVVEEKDPDILLLQEITTQVIVGEIVKAGKVKGREYKQIVPKKEEGAKKTSSEEARVLYDTKKFESQLRRNELGLAIETLDKDKTTYHVQLREKEDGKPRKAGVGKVVKERVAWVCLRRKDGPNAGKTIFFMSFHNYQDSNSYRGASVFCEAVAAMKSRTGLDVVAGVDFNCEEKELDPTQPGEPAAMPQANRVYIPDYKMSERRTKSKKKKKIDFIVTTLNPEEVSVEVVDFTASDGIASTLHGKVVEDSEGKKDTYSIEDYGTAVDHDPLLCTLTWSTLSPQSLAEQIEKDLHII